MWKVLILSQTELTKDKSCTNRVGVIMPWSKTGATHHLYLFKT